MVGALMKSAHGAIIELAIELGYAYQWEGICHGIAVTWIKACLVGQQAAFEERVSYIMAHRAEEILWDITRLKVRIKNQGNAHLNEKERQLLEILSFYDSLLLHQKPLEFLDIFADRVRTIQLDVEKIALISQSNQLEEKGGLHEVYAKTEVCTSVDDMAAYFKALSLTIKAAEQPPIEGPLSILLAGHDHTIALEYNIIKDEWTYMDINHWPPQKTKDTADLSILIRKKSAGCFISENSVSCFHTQIFSAKSDAVRLREALKGVKATTEAQAQKIDAEQLFYIIKTDEDTAINLTKKSNATELFTKIGLQNRNVMHVLAFSGNVDLFNSITSILSHEKVVELLQQKDVNGFTSVSIAGIIGHVPFIEAIAALPHGIELLKQSTDSGSSLAHIAAESGHASVIKAIAEFPEGEGLALLRQPNQWGSSPVHVAAEKGDAAVIKVIAELPYGVGLDLLMQYDQFDRTPIHVAAEKRHAAVIKVIAELFNVNELDELMQHDEWERISAQLLTGSNTTIDNEALLCLEKTNGTSKEGKDQTEAENLKKNLQPGLYSAIVEHIDVLKKEKVGFFAINKYRKQQKIEVLETLIEKAKLDHVTFLAEWEYYIDNNVDKYHNALKGIQHSRTRTLLLQIEEAIRKIQEGSYETHEIKG